VNNSAKGKAQRLLKFGLALAIGTMGGATFNYFGLPLAWMLGSMCACTFASLLKVPVAPLPKVQPVITAVLGVLLGAGFTPDLILSMLDWLPSLVGLMIFTIVSAMIGPFYFRFVGRLDKPTAMLSAMPGGLVEMTTLGQENGADVTVIALVQASRILLVVVSVPYLIWLVTGIPVPYGIAASKASVFDVSTMTYLSLVFQMLTGMALGKVLRLPARSLLGPMLISGILHASGMSKLQPPGDLIVVAQLVLGTLVGSRFAGISPTLVLRILLLSAGYVFLFLLAAVFFAKVLANLYNYDVGPLLLSYAPGGVTEMSLIALSMQTDAAFVSGHHIIRMMIVVAFAGLILKYGNMNSRAAAASKSAQDDQCFDHADKGRETTSPSDSRTQRKNSP
tara:strand:- start:44497 stop:45675 length:1179 start_codon:yes stop_codon:yes gene_type:complete